MVSLGLRPGGFYYNFSLIEKGFNVYVYSKFKAYSGTRPEAG